MGSTNFDLLIKGQKDFMDAITNMAETEPEDEQLRRKHEQELPTIDRQCLLVWDDGTECKEIAPLGEICCTPDHGTLFKKDFRAIMSEPLFDADRRSLTNLTATARLLTVGQLDRYWQRAII